MLYGRTGTAALPGCVPLSTYPLHTANQHPFPLHERPILNGMGPMSGNQHCPGPAVAGGRRPLNSRIHTDRKNHSIILS